MLGVILGSSFAPNHKGMLTIGENEDLGFLRQQVLTARNMKHGWFTTLWFGGLNIQIEHHLFPSMPRCNLKKAQEIVRNFCEDRNIAYYETSVFRSFWEILASLHEVGVSLRAKTTAA